MNALLKDEWYKGIRIYFRRSIDMTLAAVPRLGLEVHAKNKELAFKMMKRVIDRIPRHR